MAGRTAASAEVSLQAAAGEQIDYYFSLPQQKLEPELRHIARENCRRCSRIQPSELLTSLNHILDRPTTTLAHN